MTIISQIIGGIGNQMFQYAFGKYIAQQTDSELFLDINGLGRPTFDGYQKRNFALSYLNIQNLKYIYTPFHNKKSTSRNLLDYGRFFANNKFGLYKYIYNYGITKQEGFEYKDIYISKQIKSENPSNINNYLIGFWQSEKFRKPIADEIKNDFKLGYEIPHVAEGILSQIHNSNSIAINVRRADFVQIGKIANMHDVCSIKYYEQAISYIYNKYPDCKFFIFSDDINRCRDNLKFPNNPIFVDPSFYKGFEYELYMYILGQCKHYIIPNSSFARWAVYLGRNSSKTVIIPNKWFNDQNINTKDLIPEQRNAIKLST